MSTQPGSERVLAFGLKEEIMVRAEGLRRLGEALRRVDGHRIRSFMNDSESYREDRKGQL